MASVRLILALHNHQPVGNFDGVIEEAYRTSYRPFLDVLEHYPEICIALHMSGPLLEWLVDKHPEYIARLRDLAQSGRVEIIGGGFSEPILTMIPDRDRIGQIQSFTAYLDELFGVRIRGMWLAERVWEQQLVAAIADAGIEYAILDDFHFERAGCAPDALFGYHLTEDNGRLLKIFPAAEKLRYTIPFQEPHETYTFLKELASHQNGSIAVFADDGEKLGSWPKTFDHVYTNGWLIRFFDMLRANRDWIETTTFSRVVDSALPLGKVFVPDSSYREMTEWALPPESLTAFRRAAAHLATVPDSADIKRFFRAGGYWRNFKARYPEVDEMYARMLGISQRLEAARQNPASDPDYLEIARQELYRGQCNCPYWHGSFGGLYLPHLRNAIYRSLIAAHNSLDEAEGSAGPRLLIEAGDFNLDARQEVRLENEHLIAWVRPARGGHIYELDIRESATNLLATLDRRPEAYHADILAAAAAASGNGHDRSDHAERKSGDWEGLTLKQPGLERLLVYDRYPRKALVDHFYPVDLGLGDLIAGGEVERGDFVLGAYLSKIQRERERVAVVMERPGHVDGHAIRVKKTVELLTGEPAISVHYELDELPVGVCLHFGAEINLAAMAGHAPDRFYSDQEGVNLGMLDERIDLPHTHGINLTDQWLNIGVELTWSQAACLWCFPIETVSQSDGGIEGVYQSSAILPHWHVTADETRHWDVWIRWRIDRAGAAKATSEEQRPVRIPVATS